MAAIVPVEDGKIVETETESQAVAGNDMGYDQFLQLLCAEMQYQDPLEPTTNTEYVAQLATFSQTESLLNMQNTFRQSYASQLVGKYVYVRDSVTGQTLEGYVDYVKSSGNKQTVCVGGVEYSLEDVISVVDPEYTEAGALAQAFEMAMSRMPEAEDLTLSWMEDVLNMQAAYESMSPYQRSFLSSDTLTRYNELIERMTELMEEAGIDPNDPFADKDDDKVDGEGEGGDKVEGEGSEGEGGDKVEGEGEDGKTDGAGDGSEDGGKSDSSDSSDAEKSA